MSKLQRYAEVWDKLTLVILVPHLIIFLAFLFLKDGDDTHQILNINVAKNIVQMQLDLSTTSPLVVLPYTSI